MASPQKPRIAVAVAGTFHAEEMTRALIKLGYPTQLFSSLPRSRFSSLRKNQIQTLVPAELFQRVLPRIGFPNLGDRLKTSLFDRWLSNKVNRKVNPIDIIIGWSSFSLFTFRNSPNKIKILVRDSAHIETQFEILNSEFKKEGLTHPNRNWWIDRELEEYQLADAIFVLSQFAYNSFIKRGIPAHKLHILPLGIDTTTFRHTIEREVQLPLRVIYFGSISLRKGIPYLLDAFEKIPKDIATLTFIGNIEPSMNNRMEQLNKYTVVPRQKHQKLQATLQNYDIFVLPSSEDGFATVVPQALGCGLYPIVTENVGSSDLLVNPNIGKVIPAFSSEAIVDSVTQIAGDLNWFNQNRQKLTDLNQSWSWAKYDDALKRHLESILQPPRIAAVGE